MKLINLVCRKFDALFFDGQADPPGNRRGYHPQREKTKDDPGRQITQEKSRMDAPKASIQAALL
jgi:hypothetical protein